MDTKFNLSGVSTPVIVRAIMTVIVAVNVIFGYLGWHIISLSDSEVGNMVDGAIVLVTIFVWGWGWWKNNSLTLNAQIADTVLDQLKSGESNG